MKKLFYTLLGIGIAFGVTVYAAPNLVYQTTIIPLSNNAYDLGTSTAKWRGIYTQDLTVSGTCTGCGGGGGGAFPFTTTTNYATTVNATSTPIWFQNGLMASSTSYFVYASSTAMTATNFYGILTGNASTVTNGVYTTGAGTVYENPLTFTYPLTRATNAISLAFGTTTSNTWAGTQTFTNLITGSISGNAATVTTNANLTGGVTSVGNAATVITNANLTGPVTSTGNATAIADGAIATTKLAVTSTNIVYGDTTGFAGVDAALTFNDVSKTLTTTNASFTTATSTGTLTVPTGSAPVVAVTGNLALDTTSDQLIGFGGSAKKVYGNGNQYASFTYATSTAWTATTTIPLGTARVAEKWNDIQCFTDVGTLNVAMEHTTTYVSYLNASTTAGITTWNANNTLTAGEKRYADIGTPASSPTVVTCTLSKSITAD